MEVVSLKSQRRKLRDYVGEELLLVSSSKGLNFDYTDQRLIGRSGMCRESFDITVRRFQEVAVPPWELYGSIPYYVRTVR